MIQTVTGWRGFMRDRNQPAASYWPGTGLTVPGEAVPDGQYTYEVMANYGKGYERVETSVTGTVDGVTYNNGTPYLVVQGVLVALDDVTSVTDLDSGAGSNVESIMDYLGRNIKSNAPIVLKENGEVSGSDLTFELEEPEKVTIKIYDAYDELVKNHCCRGAEDLAEGSNSVSWNGLNSLGSQTDDGLYYYTVTTKSGKYVPTEVSGEVRCHQKQ